MNRSVWVVIALTGLQLGCQGSNVQPYNPFAYEGDEPQAPPQSEAPVRPEEDPKDPHQPFEVESEEESVEEPVKDPREEPKERPDEEPEEEQPPPSVTPLTCKLPFGDAPPAVTYSEGSDYLFAPSNLLLYELTIDPANWQTVCIDARERARARHDDTPDTYTKTWAQAWLKVGQESLGPIGVRIRGEVSVELIFYGDSDDDDPDPEYQDCLDGRFSRKPSFKLDFSEFMPGQRFHDQKHISLGGKEGGYSMMHDYVVSKLAASFDVPSPRVNHALVCINDVYRGVFTVQEEHDDQQFLNFHFGDESKDGNYYKTHRGSLTYYHGDDLAGYGTKEYSAVAGTEPEFNADTDLLQVLQFANFAGAEQFETDASKWLNVSAWLRLIVMETVLPDRDGMFRGRNNFLLYNHPTVGWWPIRNDWDHAFEFKALGDSASTRLRLFDLPSKGAWVPDDWNSCDGRAPLKPKEQSCDGACTVKHVPHPVIAARVIHTFRKDYLDTVHAFLETVFKPQATATLVQDRRAQLKPYVDSGQSKPWMKLKHWDKDVQELIDDIATIHADATAALTDAKSNPMPAAPVSEAEEMQTLCSDPSCWPYACP